MYEKIRIKDWIQGHPKLAGFGAAIALAIAFYPRISTMTGWIWVAVATLCLVSMLFGLAMKQDWRKASLIVSTVLVLIGLAGYGLLVAALHGARAHLTIFRYDISPPLEDHPIRFNVFVRNEGGLEGEMKGGGSSYLLPGPVPSLEKQRDFEHKAFEAMLKQQPWKTSPLLRVAPKNEIYVNLSVPSTDASTAEKLQSGELAMLLLGRMVYSDGKGEHHTDYCLLVQKYQRPFIMCQQHNEAP